MRRAAWIAVLVAVAFGLSQAMAQPPQPGPAEALRAFLDSSPAWNPPVRIQSYAQHVKANAARIDQLGKAQMVEVTGVLKVADGTSLPISFSEMTSGGVSSSPATRSGKALAVKVDIGDNRPRLRVGLQIAGQSFIVGPFVIAPARTVTTELTGGHSVTLTWTLRPLTEAERADAERLAKALRESEVKVSKRGADAPWAPLSLAGKQRPDAIRQAGAVAGLSEATIDKLIAEKYTYPANGPTTANMQTLIQHALKNWPPLGPAQSLPFNRMIGALVRSDGQVGWIYYDLCSGNSVAASLLVTGDQFVYRIVRQGRQFHLNAAVRLADGQFIEVPPTNFTTDEIKRIDLTGGHVLAIQLTSTKAPLSVCPERP